MIFSFTAGDSIFQRRDQLTERHSVPTHSRQAQTAFFARIVSQRLASFETRVQFPPLAPSGFYSATAWRALWPVRPAGDWIQTIPVRWPLRASDGSTEATSDQLTSVSSDRCIREVPAPLDALVYACHPRLVNGYGSRSRPAPTDATSNNDRPPTPQLAIGGRRALTNPEAADIRL
jgi:hypothetical protein